MRFTARIAAVALLLLIPTSGRSSDGHIRLLFDPNQCRGDIACGETRTLYVYAVLEGATASGITGIEYGMQFGLDGAPDPGWTFSEEFAPGITVTLGSGAFWPLDEIPTMPRANRGRGVNLAWGACQSGTGGHVLLEMVQVTNFGCAGTELRLFTTDHDRPSSQSFRCPLAVLCDGPVFSKICLMRYCHPDLYRGDPALCGEAVINPGAHSQSLCRITAVTPSSWSVVKNLYRNGPAVSW